jgi:hypothetical protein
MFCLPPKLQYLISLMPKQSPPDVLSNAISTQWDEVVATLRFQVGLSHNANAATEFRLGEIT